MLEKYKDKTVKMLVSSDSGIATSTSIAGSTTVSSVIQVFGKLIDFDKEFVELETTSIIYYNNTHPSTSAVDNEQSGSTLINKNRIITISLK
ncbi:MAG: hypothetical protein J6X28_00760 [Bacilli bacterium]|nr:hypothetical protein [Bacilli bacterium]